MHNLAARSHIVFVLFLLLFALPVTTRADEIVITSGYLTVPSGFTNPVFSFGNPGQGFAVSNVGYTQGDGGGFGPLCSPCKAGDIVSINGRFSDGGNLGFGAATVNGVNYDRVYFYGANLVFEAPLIVIPSDTSPEITITVPFTMTGGLALSTAPDRQEPPFFSTELRGQGFATLVLNSYYGGATFGQLYDFRQATFNFSPAAPAAVPEPATLILFGTGLTALAARYRRRR
ncbi:MAG TPA: PEP-CTERM sorting domain-containing protein [Pyrinomonadaceae bacterium]|jgi:hypothetical protein